MHISLPNSNLFGYTWMRGFQSFPPLPFICPTHNRCIRKIIKDHKYLLKTTCTHPATQDNNNIQRGVLAKADLNESNGP